MSYRTLAALVLTVTYLLILVGGATRVFGAGVSCPDWPHCYGLWWPWPEARVAALNGTGYTLNGQHFAWWQVALEWSHRALVGLLSLGVALLTLAAVPAFGSNRKIWLPLGTLLALFTVQILLGALTVRLGNIHWSVALHLGTAMGLFASLVWLRRAAAVLAMPAPLATPAPAVSPGFQKLAALFAVQVWATMVMGALVSASHAGPLCNLLTCAEASTPAHWHLAHRLLALSDVVTSILLLRAARHQHSHGTVTALLPQQNDQMRPPNTLRRSALKLHLMVWGQVALGLATLFSFAYYPQYYQILSLGHLAWGTLVFLAAVGVNLLLHYGPAGRAHT